jgi:hypothetical protein
MRLLQKPEIVVLLQNSPAFFEGTAVFPNG